MTPGPIFILAMVTLLGATAYGIWQYRRVREAQVRRDED
jgi:hypothetical protein